MDERLDSNPFVSEMRGLYRHRNWFLTPVAVAVLGALAYNAISRPVFVTYGVVAVEAHSRIPGARVFVDQPMTDAAIGREITRLQSPQLMEALVTSTTNAGIRAELASGPIRRGLQVVLTPLNELFSGARPVGGTHHSIVALQSRIEATRTGSNPWIQVAFATYDAQAGADALNALLDLYVEDARRAAEAEREAERDALKAALGRQKAAVGETLEEIKSASERTAGGNPAYRRPMVQRQLSAMQEQHAAVSARLITLAATLAVGPDGVQPTPDTPRVQSLRQRLDDLRSKLASTRDSLGERHPDVVSLTSQIEFIESEIKVEAESERKRLQAELEALMRQQRALSEALERGVHRASDVAASSFEAATLMREADAGERVMAELIERNNRGGDMPYFEARAMQRGFPASVPTSPRKVANLAGAVLFGSIAGFLLARVRQATDGSIRTISDLRELGTGVPLLGVVPRVPNLAERELDSLLVQPTPVAEAYRVARTNLGDRLQVLVVTSAQPGDGKSTTSAVLAKLLAQSGDRVLLMDADLRRPALEHWFPAAGSKGLGDALRDGTLGAHVVPSGGVDFLPAGVPDPRTAARLGDGRFAALIAEARRSYKFVVIDTPPALALADASIIGAIGDAVVLVVGASKTPSGALVATIEQLRGRSISLAGVILNLVNFQDLSDQYGSYYAAYTKYYTAQERKGWKWPWDRQEKRTKAQVVEPPKLTDPGEVRAGGNTAGDNPQPSRATESA